jgi:hypothetical protein
MLHTLLLNHKTRISAVLWLAVRSNAKRGPAVKGGCCSDYDRKHRRSGRSAAPFYRINTQIVAFSDVSGHGLVPLPGKEHAC